jgi:glutamate:GABA antiporter
MWVRRRRQARAVPGTPARPAPKRASITWPALALTTVGSVGYLGSAPPMAVFGLASVFLYVLPAIVFLLPVSLVAAELSAGWPGGVYNWVREGISAPMGLLAVWCEFAQTIFYYPPLLGYVASTLAYVIDPPLAGNGVYNAVVIIVLFWGGVLLTSRGAALVARLSAALVRARQHRLDREQLRQPGRDYPKSIFLATALVLAVFIFPTLAIAWVVPAHQISFTAGVMQAFNQLLTHFRLGFAVPLIAIALAIGALAGMMTWLDGPSEGLLRIGRGQGFLPPFFQKVNGNGIEVRILAAQGTVITLVALLYALIPSVSRAYWIFTAMATQVYLIMYVLMFIAAMRLRRSEPDRARSYKAPALGLLCLLGGVSSVFAFVIGFVPPAQFGHTNSVVYALLILAGILAIGIVPPVLMDRLRRPAWKTE